MTQADHSFFQDVYHIVGMIPKGSVLTYGGIAEMIGRPRAARIVGYAMSSAPPELNLPCHRVVNKEGRMALGSIFGGEDQQRRMLEEEGITFKADGCIDMDKHLMRWIS